MLTPDDPRRVGDEDYPPVWTDMSGIERDEALADSYREQEWFERFQDGYFGEPLHSDSIADTVINIKLLADKVMK